MVGEGGGLQTTRSRLPRRDGGCGSTTHRVTNFCFYLLQGSLRKHATTAAQETKPGEISKVENDLRMSKKLSPTSSANICSVYSKAKNHTEKWPHFVTFIYKLKPQTRATAPFPSSCNKAFGIQSPLQI